MNNDANVQATGTLCQSSQAKAFKLVLKVNVYIYLIMFSRNYIRMQIEIVTK